MKTAKIIALSSVLLLAACAEVDLCQYKEHPHSAYVRFNYDFSEVSADNMAHVDTMGIIAYRIVNQWKRLIKTDLNGTGNFVDVSSILATEPEETDAETRDGDGFTGGLDTSVDIDPSGNGSDDSSDTGSDNADDNGTAGDDNGTDTSDDDTTAPDEPDEEPATPLPGEPMAGNADRFKVLPGDYKFITFTMDPMELNLTNIFKYVQAPATEAQLSDVTLNYRMYALNDTLLKNKLLMWDDYNPYSYYVQPGHRPMIYATTPVVEVGQEQTVTVTLKPQGKLQQVDVIFDIDKLTAPSPFAVDSIWMELSGIPVKINLSTSKLDITTTGKVMAPMTLTNTSGTVGDSFNNTHLTCTATLYATGVVAPTDTEAGAGDAAKRTNGPGMLQVIIFTHTTLFSPGTYVRPG